jgi:hypothetical protein
LKHHKIPAGDFSFNAQQNYIEHKNGSRIDLLDLKYLPSDPLYERYGSVEYTGGWIEEAGEIDFGAFDTLKSRIGRFRNAEYSLEPAKLLLTANPKKGWLYETFYKPWKENRMQEGYAFIQSLVDDNNYIEASYRKNLEGIVDVQKRRRLLMGDWEYEDDPNALIEYDAILDLATNEVEAGNKYISVDVARLGDDKTVVVVWDGLNASRIVQRSKQGIDITKALVEDLAREYAVPRSRIIVDEDGVGGGLVDLLPGCKGFHANATAISKGDRKENYRSLKDQCYFLLAEKINNRAMRVNCPQDMKVALTQELEQVRARQRKNDEALAVISKDEVKQAIGRSPDLSDALMMRMYFELRPAVEAKVYRHL